jgi:hypothetical protein
VRPFTVTATGDFDVDKKTAPETETRPFDTAADTVRSARTAAKKKTTDARLTALGLLYADVVAIAALPLSEALLALDPLADVAAAAGVTLPLAATFAPRAAAQAMNDEERLALVAGYLDEAAEAGDPPSLARFRSFLDEVLPEADAAAADAAEDEDQGDAEESEEDEEPARDAEDDAEASAGAGEDEVGDEEPEEAEEEEDEEPPTPPKKTKEKAARKGGASATDPADLVGKPIKYLAPSAQKEDKSKFVVGRVTKVRSGGIVEFTDVRGVSWSGVQLNGKTRQVVVISEEEYAAAANAAGKVKSEPPPGEPGPKGRPKPKEKAAPTGVEVVLTLDKAKAARWDAVLKARKVITSHAEGAEIDEVDKRFTIPGKDNAYTARATLMNAARTPEKCDPYLDLFVVTVEDSE